MPSVSAWYSAHSEQSEEISFDLQELHFRAEFSQLPLKLHSNALGIILMGDSVGVRELIPFGFVEYFLACNFHAQRLLRKKYACKNRHFFYNYATWNLKLAFRINKYPLPVDHDSANPHDDCVLHGACYIFSRDFTAARSVAFNPATFLYMEEDILQLECVRGGLKMRYSPALQVIHLEDASTRAAYGSVYKRTKFKCVKLVESLDIFIGMLDGE